MFIAKIKVFKLWNLIFKFFQIVFKMLVKFSVDRSTPCWSYDIGGKGLSEFGHPYSKKTSRGENKSFQMFSNYFQNNGGGLEKNENLGCQIHANTEYRTPNKDMAK